jgi:hypothetical protein
MALCICFSGSSCTLRVISAVCTRNFSINSSFYISINFLRNFSMKCSIKFAGFCDCCSLSSACFSICIRLKFRIRQGLTIDVSIINWFI